MLVLEGTKYFFTILDCFSHWPEAVPMKDMAAESCARVQWQWISEMYALYIELG